MINTNDELMSEEAEITKPTQEAEMVVKVFIPEPQTDDDETAMKDSPPEPQNEDNVIVEMASVPEPSSEDDMTKIAPVLEPMHEEEKTISTESDSDDSVVKGCMPEP